MTSQDAHTVLFPRVPHRELTAWVAASGRSRQMSKSMPAPCAVLTELFHSLVSRYQHCIVGDVMKLIFHSFVRSFVRSFVCSFVRSFVHSFIHSFVRSFIHSFIHSFIRSFIHSFVPSFIPSFVYQKRPKILLTRQALLSH